jgi:hypothetical protein
VKLSISVGRREVLKKKPAQKKFRILKIFSFILIWRFNSSISFACPRDSLGKTIFAISTGTAAVIGTLDVLTAYFAYENSQKVSEATLKSTLLSSMVFHGFAAALLGGAGIVAFMGQQGADIALIFSVISFVFALVGSVSNFFVYGFEEKKEGALLGLSISTLFLNFMPVMAYFFTRAFVDPGVRDPYV